MTRRRELEQHLRMMGEIRDILASMKTLALLETRKLARRIETHARVVAGINAAAADFRCFYPLSFERPTGKVRAYLLLGAERGFCGDFNEKLLDALAVQRRRDHVEHGLLVAVGHKLCARLEGHEEIAAMLSGPNVAEEVDQILTRLIDTLTELHHRHGAFTLTVLYHHAEEREVLATRILPPFEDLAPPPRRFGYPPRLNLEPELFVAELLDHYLFAMLHDLAYASLLAENQQRMTHLDGAIRRLEQQSAALTHKRNMLRQEEITEEIEEILLSAEAAQHPGGAH